MRILLTGHYSHASGVRLTPGEYDAADPRVGGLARYLIDTEQATLIEADDTDAEVGELPSYEEMTVARLKQLADERGVDLTGATKKVDIIAALIAAELTVALENETATSQSEPVETDKDDEDDEPEEEDWSDD